MGCAKRLAHGPCGAMWNGRCEVSGEGCAHVGGDGSTGRTLALSRSLPSSRALPSFTITGEVAPPRGTDCTQMIADIEAWREVVSAVNITDNQGASVRLSSLAASKMALDLGVPAIFQLTCRDRNRLALESELLAARTFGLTHFLAVTGDAPHRPKQSHELISEKPFPKPNAMPFNDPYGNNPNQPVSRHLPRTCFDLDSTQLLELARPLGFTMGAAAFLEAEPWGAQLARIAEKIEAGATFFQTQAVMDVEKALPRIAQIQALGARVIPGVLLLKSAGVINFINNQLEGLHVPPEIAARITQAPDPHAEAIALATEQARALAEAGDGLHIMPLGDIAAGVEIIKQTTGDTCRRHGTPPKEVCPPCLWLGEGIG